MKDRFAEIETRVSQTPCVNDLVDVLPRIVGPGVNPEKNVLPHTLVSPVSRRRLGERAGDVIETLNRWFVPGEARTRVQREYEEEFACLLVRGARDPLSVDAVWSLAFFEPRWHERIGVLDWIERDWVSGRIDTFCSTAVDIVRGLCEKDLVLDHERIVFGQGRVARESLIRGTYLETYSEIQRHNPELMDRGILYPVRNLVSLVVGLRPERLVEFVGKWDHPAVQLLAAEVAASKGNHRDPAIPASWMTQNAGPEARALALIEGWKVAANLDREEEEAERISSRAGGERTPAEEREVISLGSAERALGAMLRSLDTLGDDEFGMWMGEALRESFFSLPTRARDGRKPLYETFEAMAVTLAGERLQRTEMGDGLTRGLVAGLRLPPRATAMRHLHPIAEILRESKPERSKALLHLLLEDYEQKISLEERHSFFIDYDRCGRMWTAALGCAVSRSLDGGSPLSWVRERLVRLPLSEWDAEEDYGGFLASSRVASHLALVGCIAIELCAQGNRAVPAQQVTAFARGFWDHLRLAWSLFPRLDTTMETSAVNVVRVMVAYGAFDRDDFEKLVESRSTPARALAVLLDADPKWEKNERLVRSLEDRFQGLDARNPAELLWWGYLWDRLDLDNPAARVMHLLESGSLPFTNRTGQVLLLKLQLRRLRQERKDGVEEGELQGVRRWIVNAYRDLWGLSVEGPEQDEKGWVDRTMAELGIPQRGR